MPTDTFNKLPEEKKTKVILAAKKEFARANLRDASIKNIVQEAGIARGSFYQYFESKEDLLQYLLKENVEQMNKNFENALKESNGDIFEVFISIYDYMVNECINKEEPEFFKRILEELKTSQDDMFIVDMKKYRPKDISEYYDLVNKKDLRIKSIDEFRLLTRMLHAVTKKSIVGSFKYDSKEKAREDYLKQLEYIKYGVMRKGGANV